MDLSRRLELLENETAVLKKRMRGWRVATGTAILAGLIASCRSVPPPSAVAQTPGGGGTQKELKVETPRIVDEEGKNRAVMGYQDGGTALAMMDKTGKMRVTLALTADGDALLTVLDSKEKVRSAVGVNAKGTPIVSTFDAEGKQNDLTAE